VERSDGRFCLRLLYKAAAEYVGIKNRLHVVPDQEKGKNVGRQGKGGVRWYQRQGTPHAENNYSDKDGYKREK
jgi:hypothetical protein